MTVHKEKTTVFGVTLPRLVVYAVAVFGAVVFVLWVFG